MKDNLHKYSAFDNICVWIKTTGFFKLPKCSRGTLQVDRRKDAVTPERIFTARLSPENGSKSYGAFTGLQIIHILYSRSLFFGRSGAR